MPSSTVRISKESSQVLKEMAAREKTSLQTVLDRAIEEYRRNRFLQEANKAYLLLKENPGKWKVEMDERKQWEATLADGQKD
jgi:predicted transcriptional regulator